jgi:DNA repair exonuclease SbcCD ATPase subunit
MKQLIILSSFIIIFLSGCKNYKNEFEQVSQERDSLINAGDVKDSSINSFLVSFNEIESNLDTIAHKSETIEQNASPSGELNGTQRERINENIRIINDLLEKNHALVNDLQKKIRSQGSKITELKKMTDKLNDMIAQKDSDLVSLKLQLDELKMNVENLNVTIDTLTAQNKEKTTVIEDKTQKLQTAYYIIGTYKELRDKSIVDKEGGFLGIGKNQMLKHDFNSDAFTKIDITKTSSIDLNCKNVKLITVHPSHSYAIDKEGEKVKSIVITDYEKFWGVSKYLVIVKD